jgi:hypothetical protein
VDLSKAISYNSLSINTATRSAGGLPTSGYIVNKFQPYPPTIDSYFERRALADGMDAGDVYLAERRFGLIVTVLGTSQGDFWDKAQDLLAAFNPTIAYSTDSANRGFLPLDFYQPTADIATWPTSSFPNGIPLRYYVRPMHQPVYIIERDKDGGTASRGFSKRFEISLHARDPRKYLQTMIATTVTSSPQTASYRGDYPTWPVLTWSMSAAGSSAFGLSLGGATWAINLSTQTSGSLELDFGKGTFINTQTNSSLMGLVGNTEAIPPVRAGFQYFANNPPNAAILMSYREAFS